MTKTETEDIFIQGFDAAIRVLERAHPRCEEDEDCGVCDILREFGCDCDECVEARGGFDISSFN